MHNSVQQGAHFCFFHGALCDMGLIFSNRHQHSARILYMTVCIRGIDGETKYTPLCGWYFKCIFLNKTVWISIKISLKYINHYLNQWWLDYQPTYASLGLNELRPDVIHVLCIWKELCYRKLLHRNSQLFHDDGRNNKVYYVLYWIACLEAILNICFFKLLAGVDWIYI